MRKLLLLLLGCAALAAAQPVRPPGVFVEAESFDNLGGWVVDQQFMDQMGSAFLLAHGMGVPVADASTTIEVPAAGSYHVWVRTRDWVAPWGAPGAPGRFQLLVNGKALPATFGTEGASWHWQHGGTVALKKGRAELRLRDLTGFEGRCDAIFLAPDTKLKPPDGGSLLKAFRRQWLGLPDEPAAAGEFDFVVVGGGMAGTAAAVAAARLGLKVALIQDRPVLGGNTSSEIRVGLGGAINLPPYPAIGVVVAELDPGKGGNAQPAANYDDERKLAVVRAEKNIRLFLNSRAVRVEMQGNRIASVIATDVLSGREMRFSAPLFADCTGDGNLGAMAGADFRYGRESRSETGESMAPAVADRLVMGTSVMWYSEDAGKPSPFPETPWALPFNEETVQNATRGDWDWETGQDRHQIEEFEFIRDHAFRAIYGNWSYQKNHSKDRAKYENLKLAWVAYVGGKRESRRLLGDVILQEQDIIENRQYPDAAVTATWSIDLHLPSPRQSEQFPGQEFRSVATWGKKRPYAIPYRCFYSRNIENLFMAGRNISVTHVALGTVRVMRTTGMMGEVVGMAAAVARRHNITPRGVYLDHLEELKELMKRGVGKTSLAPPARTVPPGYSLAWSEEWDGALDRTKWTVRTDSTQTSTQLNSNVTVQDGGLLLKVDRVAASGGSVFTGAGVIGKQELGPGYYEARMRVRAGRGWLTTFEVGDVVPFENNSADTTHYRLRAGAYERTVPTTTVAEYHIYGCEVTAGAVRFFLDGEPVGEVQRLAPAAPVRLRIGTVASGESGPYAVDPSRLPGYVDVDYIRYYRKESR